MAHTRTARQTGTKVTVGTADEMWLDPEGGKWAVICEEHGIILSTETRKLAESHATDPAGWCEQCREGLETES